MGNKIERGQVARNVCALTSALLEGHRVLLRDEQHGLVLQVLVEAKNDVQRARSVSRLATKHRECHNLRRIKRVNKIV